MAPLAADALDLARHGFGVVHGQDREWDEPAGMFTGQLVDLPVVVRGDHDVGEVAVDGGARQRHPVEAGERGETHRRQDTVGVHIADAQVGVVGGRSHLGESGRVEVPLLVRP